MSLDFRDTYLGWFEHFNRLRILIEEATEAKTDLLNQVSKTFRRLN